MADRRYDSQDHKDAPHSRLFVLGSKELGEDDIREAFGAYGYIKFIRTVKDRNTGENKGIFYVKFAKTSEAARALEELNRKPVGGKTLKVMVAASPDQVKADIDIEQTTRLFIAVSKSMSDDDIYKYFKQFGELEYASAIKNRETKESKGFAFVKFRKFSDAARAFEECDKKYKAVFADPPKPKEDFRQAYPADMPLRNEGSLFDQFSSEGVYKISVTAPLSVNQDQIWKIFDIVPSLDYCQHLYENDRGRTSNFFEVVYNNLECAEHAVKKLHGFEYPPGQRLIVKFTNDFNQHFPHNSPRRPLQTKRPASFLEPQTAERPNSDLLKLAETLAQANSLIKAAGLNPDLLQSNSRDGILPRSNFCSVELPDTKALASPDSTVEARCFVVCIPTSLSQTVLRDVFCRFGDLIDVYLLPNKNCGYAKYASRESALAAIETLNEAETMNVRLKVIEADDLPEKKLRTK